MASSLQPRRGPLPCLKRAALGVLLTSAYVEAGRLGLGVAFENPDREVFARARQALLSPSVAP